jgi:hypothetical protein
MFNSQMLDTAIGLVFIYFFLSLLCSVIIESITGLTKKRPRMLRDGILSLLQDPNALSKLYEQPLFMGNSAPKNLFKSLLQNLIPLPFKKKTFPSYISSRSFVLSLLESLKQHPDVVKKLLKDKTSLLDDKLKIAYFRNKLNSLPDSDTTKDALLPLLRAAEADPTKASSAIATCYDKIVDQPDIFKEILKEIKSQNLAFDSVQHIRDLVNSLSDDNAIKKALLPLLETVGDSLDKAIANMEKWYDEGMERVTGWYKRYFQAFALILGFFVALVLNADTFQIGKAIYRDQALRNSLVVMADEAIKESPSATKQSSPGEKPKPAGTAPSTGQEKPGNVKQGAEGQPPSGAPDKELEEKVKKVNEMYKQISSVNLPIGWPLVPSEKGSLWVSIGFTEKPDLTDLGLVKLLGFLLTALMVSLGSNFWFELLNKLLNMRNAGKKPLTREEQDAQKKQDAV